LLESGNYDILFGDYYYNLMPLKYSSG